MVITDGENGLLVPVGDENALASSNQSLNRRPTAGRQIRQKCRLRYQNVRDAG